MLVIRQAQLDALTADRRRRFTDEMALRAAMRHPDALTEFGHAELHARVRQAVERSLACGIDGERDVATFVDLALELGPLLEAELRREWAVDMLGRAGLSGSLKMRHLLERVEPVRSAR
jgi:hypothetical protein